MEALLSTWLQPAKKGVISRRIGFADMKQAVNLGYIVLNTLPETQQGCLIKGSVAADEEEERMNDYLEHEETDKIVVLYGANSCDESVDRKVEELGELGFRRVYVYTGGLFEWLLLQDVYGVAEFPTTGRCTDLLVFQPGRRKF